jgi:hypothetical protein
MRITVQGHHLPGEHAHSDGRLLEHVRVGVQDGRHGGDLLGPVSGGASQARWDLDVRVVIDADGGVDLRGPVVHGRRGDRFLYLSWCDEHADGSFAMFRRAKLMLDRIDAQLVARAIEGPGLVARVDLTMADGSPLCARVDPPAISWSLGDPSSRDPERTD